MQTHKLATAMGLGLAGAVLALVIAGSPPAFGAGARYVATSGRDTLPGDAPNDCASPADPCASVQHAVSVADPGDEVRIATGVYTQLHTADGYTQSVFISRTIAIRGGYSADFTEWDPTPSATVLDAGSEGRGAVITGTAASPVTLEALRFSNGTTPDGGGGIYVVGARVVIRGCEVISATAENEGGGIFVRGGDGSTIVGTAVVDTAGIINGCGGICVVDSEDVTIDHVDVSGSQGTGVLVHHSTNVTISNSSIHDSWELAPQLPIGAFQMGGIGITRTLDARILHNHVYGNGALEASGVAVIQSDNPTIVGNYIHGNRSRVASGIYVGDCRGAMLVNNMVYSNILLNIQGQESKAPGILIYAAGAAGSGPPYDAVLLHNTVLGNTGGGGEGIYVEFDTPTTVTLTNNIIVSQSVGMRVTGGNTATMEATLWGAGAWANSKDWAGTGTILTGTVNLWEPPAFLNASGGNYHLGAFSPAIDAAVDAGVWEDIDRDPRPFGAGPDIGADEFWYRISLPLVLRAAD